MPRKFITILGISVALLLAGAAGAQDADPTQDADPKPEVCRFIDEDGDGFNDLAPDADGDGIPNGLDPDYVRPQDGEGQQHQWRWANGLFAKVFGFSLDGEMNGNSHGFGDGSGQNAGPGNGTGFGPGDELGSGAGNGQSQAEQAGHRGGRR